MTDRRTILIAAGAAAVAAAAAPVAAQSAEIRGAITVAGGGVVPEGRVSIVLEDPGMGAGARLAETGIDSDGGSRTIAFTLSRPPGVAASPTLRLVARLERADGWLLARGSPAVGAAARVDVTLEPVAY